MPTIQRYQIETQANLSFSVIDSNDGTWLYENLTKLQALTKASDLNAAEDMRAGRTLLPGLTLDANTIRSSGELVYRICDNVGVLDESIFPHRLDKYFM